MPEIDPILTAAPPQFSPDDAVASASRCFGIAATDAVSLGSERDQAFALLAYGERVGILKVSNGVEDPDIVDMEAAAALHIARVDPALPIPLPLRALDAGDHADPDDPSARRSVATSAAGSVHMVRAYPLLAGTASIDPAGIGDVALGAWGAMVARVGRALRGFVHPRALRSLPWDVQYAHHALGIVDHIEDPEIASVVVTTLRRWADDIVPRLPGLRFQVIHGDITVDNALSDSAGRPVGVIDFGDMSHSTLVADLASVLGSVTAGRSGDDMFRAARLVLDGYQAVTPLDEDELDIVVEAWMARNAATVAITSWRIAEGLEDPAYSERYRRTAAAQLRIAATCDPTDLARQAWGPARPVNAGPLTERRDAAFGSAIEPLSYRTPVRPVTAEGCWIIEADGRRLLDMYNNVPCVGHSHPRVVEAIHRQARRLNINMRYLHETSIELAERLVATCPPGLDTVLYVNSGTEANDLAWRLATMATGNRGGLCTSFAYHGISPTMALFSPETLEPGADLDFVATWDPPDAYRSRHLGTEGFAAALTSLETRGLGLAATILDGVLQSDGVLDPEPAYIQELQSLTHAAGGLWIADEVQGGHGRTGAMWSFERFGIEPDIITLGKPMGNGHPVAAVICRRELAERFAAETVFFSTFGGNPVSAAAAVAVLDVLEDEQVLERTAAAGAALRSGLAEIDDPRIGDVRGVGLANGVEIVGDDREPDRAEASRIKESLRGLGVLVGTTGAAANVLKIRPPLAFTAAEVPVVVDALRAALRA